MDAKLALEPKPYFLIQLCNYSEHVARLQGTMPAHAYVILGSGEERKFRLEDFSAYYRHLKERFLARMQSPADAYPYECAHCAVCPWREQCEQRRDADDYLGLVARMRSDQIEKLASSGITTIAQLAAASPAGRPKGMAEKTFMNLQAQAALQHRQRQSRANGDGVTCFYDLIDHEPGTGLEALPVPDEGDVFFDMEGDPLYAADHGLEYLFGVYVPADDSYKAFWARSDRDERKAFEGLVDFLEDRRARFPRMHVYHYAPYEKTALCRLMGQYNSRQDVIDAYLRQGVFVDLFAVVRQALRISQPKYSIKMLEPFYGLERKTDVRRGDESIVIFEAWLASGDDALLTDIERYNEDDCRSTYRLREWLLERRRELAGRLRRELPWCVPSEISEAAEEEPSELQQLARRLLDGVPEPLSLAQFRALGGEQRVRWLLGHMLEYHRREEKPAWWKYFERIQNPDQLTEFDSEAIGDLQWRQDIHPLKVSPMDRNLVYTYEFPDQEYNLGASRPWCPHTKSSAGEIRSIDPDARRLQIKLNGKLNPEELRALIPGPPIRNAGQRDAVRRAAEAYERQDLEQQLPAVYDLLIAALPRLSDRTRGTVVQPPQVSAAAISAVVQKLAGGYLFIQGPPGTGKSTKAASVVVDLLDAGKRVGVMSRSHKAIHNLLGKAEKEAARRGTTFRGIYKYSEFAEDSRYQSPLPASMVVNTKDAADVTTAAHDLVAGTAWLFAKVELAQSFDYLFIDEAGQVSLADAVACAQAARNVVLIGDPLQLAQVSQGFHPVGTDLSVLQHVLGDDQTVRPEHGIFLDESYRMHPDICTFVSRSVYEGRLRAGEAAFSNAVESNGKIHHGLRYLPVTHRNNSPESAEEAADIVHEIGLLLQGRVRSYGRPWRAFAPGDFMVVTPYNAQRRRIEGALAAAGLTGVRVGTVDKFQGQEAPVVFYSMATSSGADLPRDVGFLFERNRLNVAVSRAQCMTVLVCSPQLLDVSCASPEAMAPVNLFCAFVETATPLKPGSDEV